VLSRRKNPGAGSDPGLPLFDQPFYRAITQARLSHMATLDLPLEGRSVIDVGCGIGRLSEFFVERGCDVFCVDGREENIELLRREYPGRRAAVVDVEGDDLLAHGQFDVFFCYGLLYHLAEPFGFIRRAAEISRELMVIETCICDADEHVSFLVRDPQDPTMALEEIGSRPSPAYVATALRASGFEHVYSPRHAPDHPDFQYRRLSDLSYFRDGHALRDIFVAAREPLDSPALEALPASSPPPESG
jgi:SAM-dependent methyltransferase